MKKSEFIFRNIGGILFKHETSDPSQFDSLKKECKEKGLKYRVLKGLEFLIEHSNERIKR